VAVDPRTGEILALVGGRSYNQTQFNRALEARRQPGSVFKPFVYLAAFETAARDGRTDLTPASLTVDEPATFTFDDQVWEPKNYDEYDGEITWRRALAMSRNLGTIHVGESVGFDKVANLWRRVGVGTPPHGYPSITLGVFELTPIEVATAYTLFTNGGSVRRSRPSGSTLKTASDPHDSRAKPVASGRRVWYDADAKRAQRTGAGARAANFTTTRPEKPGPQRLRCVFAASRRSS
jgi:penicillin-binding protein 1B